MVVSGCQGKGWRFSAHIVDVQRKYYPALTPGNCHVRVGPQEESQIFVLHLALLCVILVLEVYQMELKRCNLYLDVDLVSKLDEFARSHGISRTAAVSVILGEYFKGVVAVDALQAALQLIKSKGEH